MRISSTVCQPLVQRSPLPLPRCCWHSSVPGSHLTGACTCISRLSTSWLYFVFQGLVLYDCALYFSVDCILCFKAHCTLCFKAQYLMTVLCVSRLSAWWLYVVFQGSVLDDCTLWCKAQYLMTVLCVSVFSTWWLYFVFQCSAVDDWLLYGKWVVKCCACYRISACTVFMSTMLAHCSEYDVMQKVTAALFPWLGA
jgi:hypothetical protein